MQLATASIISFSASAALLAAAPSAAALLRLSLPGLSLVGSAISASCPSRYRSCTACEKLCVSTCCLIAANDPPTICSPQ